MTAIVRYLIHTSVFLVLNYLGKGQTPFISSVDTTNIHTTKDLQSFKPPKNREIFHDYIDAEQKNILKSVEKSDSQFVFSLNEETNLLVIKSLVNRVDSLQYEIEKDNSLNHQHKVRYLRGIENLLKFFAINSRAKKVRPALLPDIITAYEDCMQKDKEEKTIETIISVLPYEIAYSVVKADKITFEKNPGYKASQDILVLKYCMLHREETLITLKDNPDLPFADSLVRMVAKKYPAQLYDYAQANNKLGDIIRNINDDVFIKSIVQMANSKSGQQYFPFLDNIVNGRMTIEEIDSVKDDSLEYYKLLVKTQMDYVERAMNKDTAFEFKSLTKRLEGKATDVFINTINGLHEEVAGTRFKIIQPLNAQELYYLAVFSDGTIYTSSFVKGVYPLLMKRINYHGDSLLALMKFDRYRKFIRMTAGYNTLSNFLSTFQKSKKSGEDDPANTLMKDFVSGLEKADGLEDGVDVADSYASIAETIRPVANEMLRNIQRNYQRNVSQNNKKGVAIYNILYKLFQSADATNKIDLTKDLGIPPVYEVPYESLVNDSGRIVIQVFFYSDKKVQGIFRGFVDIFNNANWKITGNDQWVCITSVKGKPVSIYANKALPEENGEDEIAQKALGDYLEENNLYPTITIHRGHSYTAPYTIAQMSPASKIVFLGSCGGYQIIHDVLEKAPDAHIISTKQIADAPVNLPFFLLLTNKIRNGNNIDWIPFWKELDKMITAKIFEDYIPPYKNLGAIFIKAYKKAMGEE